MVYTILSKNYFDAARVSPKSIIIEREQILSGPQNLKITETSWPYNLSMPSKPYFIRDSIIANGGDGAYMPTEFIATDAISALRVTSNNTKRFRTNDYLRNGDFAPTIDDVNPYNPNSFDSWKDAGERSPPSYHEYISPTKKTIDSVVIVSFSDRPWQAPKGQTPLPKFVTDVYSVNYPNNGLGPALSRAETVKQDVMDYLRTDEGKALIARLSSFGGKPEYIDGIAVGGVPKGAIYGVGRAKNKVILFVAEDAYDLIVQDAKFYRISPKDRKREGIAEELTHIWLGHIDDERNLTTKEIEAKLFLANEHYAKLEEDAASGNPRNPKYPREKERYRRLKEFKEDDARTTPIRYRDLYSQNKALLNRILERDAIEKGLRGGAVEEYVEGRLAQIEAEVENSKFSKLEQIAEKGPDSKEAPKEAEANAEAQ